MADRIRVGVVGAHAERGWGRHIHLPALRALNDFQVTAVAGTTAASARAAAEVWGAQRSYDDARALMADPDVDLVTVAVQLPSRDGLVEAAIAAGRHVYSEWPLAPDAATAERFESAARAAGVRHAVGLQSRHHPEVRLLREMLAQGLIGEVLSASLLYSLATPEVWSTRYAALFDETKGVNHLAVVGGHSLDMFQYAVGEFTEVSATLATRIDRITMEETGEPIEVTSPDQIVLGGLLESGAAASAHFMTGGPRGDGFRIEVHGRTGRLVLVSSDDSLVGPRFTLTHAPANGSPARELAVSDAHRPLLGTPSAVSNVAQVYTDLARAIRTGDDFGPDFTTAVRVHRLLDAVRSSAGSGRRVRLG
ncbi:Gfo/Idh/MocA family oxidoreductase [Streptomyces sp. Root369]|uniref:Gfo/Idh/MocA family protein n=1 Tax=Streptomyces sp. Root369 TaxID=1736523 RepID=UPI00070F5D75|nr:Gfo/Idh/MocA family oxidoreductase [Streptomyces sp. Root369]KQV98914.1 gfo/Idh/MocA family oxidoreductase [Streptomyces sp. Root369]